MGQKGRKSKTHSGLDYETRKSDKDFHEGGHDIKKARRPYHKAKGAKGANGGDVLHQSRWAPIQNRGFGKGDEGEQRRATRGAKIAPTIPNNNNMPPPLLELLLLLPPPP